MALNGHVKEERTNRVLPFSRIMDGDRRFVYKAYRFDTIALWLGLVSGWLLMGIGRLLLRWLAWAVLTQPPPPGDGLSTIAGSSQTSGCPLWWKRRLIAMSLLPWLLVPPLGGG